MIGAVLATACGVALLAAVAAVGVRRGMRRLRPVRWRRWLMANIAPLRRWKVRQLRRTAPRAEGNPLTRREELVLVRSILSVRSGDKVRAAAEAEAAHQAATEADR